MMKKLSLLLLTVAVICSFAGSGCAEEVSALPHAGEAPLPDKAAVTQSTPALSGSDSNSAAAESEAYIELLEDQIKSLLEQTSYLTPEEFGAVGNGIADDTAAIQRALENNPLGLPLVFENTYCVTSVSVPSHTKLVFGKNAKIISRYQNGIGEKAAFYAAGSVTDKKNPIGSYSGNSISYTPEYRVGDYILLYHENDGSYETLGMYQIIRADDDSFYLSACIPHENATHSARAEPCFNVELLGDRTVFENAEGNGGFGDFINLSLCVDAKVSGLCFESKRGRGITIYGSMHTRVEDCVWSAPGADIRSATAPLYEAFLDIFGNDTLFHGCRAVNSRGGFDFAGSIYSKAEYCVCENARLRTHGLGARYVSFNTCTVFMEKTFSGCATFGNSSTARMDKNIYCNNCLLAGGVYGIYVDFGTENVVLNQCEITGTACAMQGSGDPASHISGDVYVNMCTQHDNDQLVNGNYGGLFVNGIPVEEPSQLLTGSSLIAVS